MDVKINKTYITSDKREFDNIGDARRSEMLLYIRKRAEKLTKEREFARLTVSDILEAIHLDPEAFVSKVAEVYELVTERDAPVAKK